jgi:hypothetical protein
MGSPAFAGPAPPARRYGERIVQVFCGRYNGKKKVWRLIQKPVCGKKVVTSKSAKAFDYVIMLRIADGRSSWSGGGVLAGC